MNAKKYIAVLLVGSIYMFSGCGGQEAQEIPVVTSTVTETTQSAETTVTGLPLDDLLSFAEDNNEQEKMAEVPENIPVLSDNVNETIHTPTETTQQLDIPAITTPGDETVPPISGNENQLPLG